jgi:ethanolamine transporter
LINEMKNGDVFTESLQSVMDGFSINTLILIVMMIFTAIGALDKIRGNTSGYGEKFDEAFYTMGPLAIAMVGIITMVPIIELTLEPLIAPVYSFFGASPAMFAGTVLPIDSGAYPLAMQMAGDDKAIGNFSGLILGGTFGMIITGLVPLALTILRKEDHPFFAAGVLVALITIPLGCVAGGLVMNMTPYKMDFARIMVNLVPVIIVSLLIALGLIFKPQAVMNGFSAFGKAFSVLLTISTALAVIQFVTGLRLPVFRLMVEAPVSGGQSPLMESIYVVGTIALMLTGAFPMVHWVTKTFQKPLTVMGERLGMNEIGSAGMFAGLANLIPTLNMTKDMNDKAKFLNIAFGVSASFVLGDHLGFTASMNQDMIFPMIVGKLVAGLTALFLAHRLSSFLLPWIRKSGSGQAAGDSQSERP